MFLTFGSHIQTAGAAPFVRRGGNGANGDADCNGYGSPFYNARPYWNCRDLCAVTTVTAIIISSKEGNVMRQLASFSAGMAAALTFWHFVLSAQLKQGMAGKDSDHPFLTPFFLSCLILIVCYLGVSWLLAKDRRVSRENLLRGVVSFVAGLVASVVFWFAAAGVIISLRRPGRPTGNWLYELIFLGLVTFFLADRFVYRSLERRSAARQLQH